MANKESKVLYKIGQRRGRDWETVLQSGVGEDKERLFVSTGDQVPLSKDQVNILKGVQCEIEKVSKEEIDRKLADLEEQKATLKALEDGDAEVELDNPALAAAFRTEDYEKRVKAAKAAGASFSTPMPSKDELLDWYAEKGLTED